MIPLFAALATLALAVDPEPPTRDELQEQLDTTRAELDVLRAQVDELRTAPPAPPPPPAPVASTVSYADPVVVPFGATVADAISAAEVRVDGRVTGNATSFGGDVIVGPEGVVEGDATTFSGRVRVEPGGQIDGNRVAFSMALPGAQESESAVGPTLLDGLYHRMVMVLSFAGAGVLMVGFFPRRIGRVARLLEQRPVHSAFVGTFASGFIGLFSLLVTVLTLGLGLPIALVLLGGLGVAWLLGFMGLCQAVGDHLPFEQKPHGRWVAFLVGVVVVASIGSLPWLGWLVLVGTGLLGVGAALTTRFGAEA